MPTENTQSSGEPHPKPAPATDRPGTDKPRRSRLWRAVITVLVLAVLAGVIAQGVFLFRIYSRLEKTSRSLADELLGIVETPRGTEATPGQGDQPQRRGPAQGLGLLDDLLGQQGQGDAEDTLQGLLDALRGGIQTRPRSTGAGADDVISTPPTDVYMGNGRYTIVCDMPGIDRETVRTSINGKTMTVSAAVKPKQPTIPGDVQPLSRERTQQVYQKILDLPTAVDPESVSWDYADGVLTVTAQQSS